MTQWTKEPPTRPGWYWHREREITGPVEVQLLRGELQCWVLANDNPLPMSLMTGLWWSVPIEPPPTEGT